MRQAVKTKDKPEHSKTVKRRRKQEKIRALRKKTFEELDADDRDLLLKVVAIRLDLIKSSPLKTKNEDKEPQE